MVAVSLKCSNCGKSPTEHVVRNERLTCADQDREWQWSRDDQAIMLMERIDYHEQAAAKLTTTLFRLINDGIDRYDEKLIQEANSHYSSVQLAEMK